MEWGGIKCVVVGWDSMRYSGMEWDGIKCCVIGWDSMKCGDIEWAGMRSGVVGWDRIVWDGITIWWYERGVKWLGHEVTKHPRMIVDHLSLGVTNPLEDMVFSINNLESMPPNL